MDFNLLLGVVVTYLMDINHLRSITTVVTFIVFVGIVMWAWSRRNQAAFEEAANLPFEQD